MRGVNPAQDKRLNPPQRQKRAARGNRVIGEARAREHIHDMLDHLAALILLGMQLDHHMFHRTGPFGIKEILLRTLDIHNHKIRFHLIQKSMNPQHRHIHDADARVPYPRNPLGPELLGASKSE